MGWGCVSIKKSGNAGAGVYQSHRGKKLCSEEIRGGAGWNCDRPEKPWRREFRGHVTRMGLGGVRFFNCRGDSKGEFQEES